MADIFASCLNQFDFTSIFHHMFLSVSEKACVDCVGVVVYHMAKVIAQSNISKNSFRSFKGLIFWCEKIGSKKISRVNVPFEWEKYYSHRSKRFIPRTNITQTTVDLKKKLGKHAAITFCKWNVERVFSSNPALLLL